MTNPTVVRFAEDGRVFVAEKSGLIKVFDNLADTTPTVFADLRTNVYNFWDRGLLGMALHPGFPQTPYVYVLYTYDHILGQSAPPPRWGAPGATSDPCPNPPGATSDGCVVSARLSRLQAAGSVMAGTEQVLVEDWCQQYPSHSIGTVEFGPDGKLYASGGDGASFTFADYGQDGNPVNPCGDPGGSAPAPPSAEGGALRSQDLRSAGDPVSLDGAIIRVEPATGAAPPDNPLAGSADPNARKIIAYGLRNPLRFAFRPGSSEMWVGDVGWSDWEEINRIVSPVDGTVENFGWPCYEGNPRQSGYDSANLGLCENLYAANTVTNPYHAYHHNEKVVAGETCPIGSSSIAGLSFEYSGTGNSYPVEYQDALFFADYSRDCIWVMQKGATGQPSPGQIRTFVAGAANPVNLEFGPGGELYYPDFDGGTIRRIRYSNTSSCPSGQYRAEYYANTTLSGSPATAACEPTIDYNWGTGGPGGVPSDGFSARWVGNFSFAGGSTTFKVIADDGVRLFVDGELVLDRWIDQSPTTYEVVRTLAAGTHEVKVEYYENAVDAVISVRWGDVPTNCPAGQYLATYYGNMTLDGPAARTLCENSIEHNWGTGSPGAGVPSDGFSARWVGNFSFGGGSTTFEVTADDGVRLFVDGELVLDRWIDQSATTYQVVRTLTAGTHEVKVEYYENGVAAEIHVNWSTAAANAPPVPTIVAPTPATTWTVGDTITFSGSAADAEDGQLPASLFTWTLLLHHCPSNCHTHTIQSWDDVASGSFSAPDHDYPSHLQLRLAATDSHGATGATSVELDPRTVALSFASSPSGLQLTVNGTSSTAPFTRAVIVGSTNSLSAVSPQTLGGTSYTFNSWSDGGAQTHTITAPQAPATFTSTYVASAGAPPTNMGLPSISGQPREGRSMTVSNGTWSGSTPMTFAYQWLRCDSAGGACLDIAGANAQTYTPTAADVGRRLRARVTATNLAGSATATSSPSSVVKRGR